jgi:hypothetical protein
MRIAAMIVLAIDLVVSTGYMLLFAAGVGLLGLLYGHGNLSLALIVLAACLAVALLGSSLLWRLKKERRWWSRVGLVLNALWAVLSLLLGIGGYPFFTPFGLAGLVISGLMVALALRERSAPTAAALT